MQFKYERLKTSWFVEVYENKDQIFSSCRVSLFCLEMSHEIFNWVRCILVALKWYGYWSLILPIAQWTEKCLRLICQFDDLTKHYSSLFSIATAYVFFFLQPWDCAFEWVGTLIPFGMFSIFGKNFLFVHDFKLKRPIFLHDHHYKHINVGTMN